MPVKQGSSPKLKHANGPRKAEVAKAGRRSGGAGRKHSAPTPNTGLLDELVVHSFHTEKTLKQVSQQAVRNDSNLAMARVYLVEKVYKHLEKTGRLSNNCQAVRGQIFDFIHLLVMNDSDSDVAMPKGVTEKKAGQVKQAFLEVAPSVILAANLPKLASWRRLQA